MPKHQLRTKLWQATRFNHSEQAKNQLSAPLDTVIRFIKNIELPLWLEKSVWIRSDAFLFS
jgi:hypothetical protein